MITKFNIFESIEIKDDPKVGEYVLCVVLCVNTDIPNSNILNKIGQLTKIIDGQYYIVTYEDDSHSYFLKDEIIHHSPIKDDLQIYLDAKNYNL